MCQVEISASSFSHCKTLFPLKWNCAISLINYVQQTYSWKAIEKKFKACLKTAQTKASREREREVGRGGEREREFVTIILNII